jgi:malonyl CoA-acyl carrier protein transacylase
VLGLGGRPERLLMVPENMPVGKLAVQGFVGAAFLVHNLALAAHLRAAAEDVGVRLRFVGYTGESLGMIAAAVASGAVSVGDGVRLGYVYTPLMLTAAEGLGPEDPLAAELAAYLPESLRGRRLVSEPYHVVGLRGDPGDLGEILAGVARFYPKTDVEVHKFYSPRQANIYVRAGVKPDFDLFARGFPAVETAELKPPTTFLAHAERMTGVRQAFGRFMTDNGIVFREPHTPVVSNNNSGVLASATEVRNAVLAITNEVMASQTCVETLDSLRPDVVLELGLGNKSVQLLTDNNIDVPVTSYTGTTQDTTLFLRTLQLADALLGELEHLHTTDDRLTGRHYHTLREIFRLSREDPFCEGYFYRTLERVIAGEVLHPDRVAASAAHELLEIFQHTYNYQGHIDVGNGELVLQARTKKQILGHTEGLGQVYTELKVIDGSGIISDRTLTRTEQHEVVVFHFDQLPGLSHADLAANTRLLLDTQPLARQIYDHVCDSLNLEDNKTQTTQLLTPDGGTAPTTDRLAASYLVYQYTLFQLLHLYRPAIFQHDYYLAGSDPMGWLVALAASGAAALPDAVRLYRCYQRTGPETEETKTALDRMLTCLHTPQVPILSPQGTPVQAKIDLEATTRAVFG